MTSIHPLEQTITAWALAQDDVRAAIVVGSQARRDHPADEYSDLDVIFFVTAVDPRINDSHWIHEIGDHWLVQPGHTSAGDPELLVLFPGGKQVDFVFNQAAVLDALPHLITAGRLPDILYRGVRVLFDKDNQIPPLPAPGPVPPAAPPDEVEFFRTLDSFWFSAVYCAKQLRRGELFVFQQSSGGMTWPLLRMVEWQARAVHGWGFDTWHAGKFIAEWADPAVYDGLQDCFAGLDDEEGLRAIEARVALFQSLARQVAGLLGFSYPAHLEDQIAGYLDSLSGSRANPAAA